MNLFIITDPTVLGSKPEFVWLASRN
jgi:hypothetical protein